MLNVRSHGSILLALVLAAGAAGAALPAAGAARIHLHRPGTDIDADELTGNLGAGTYTVKGNVTVHSDPRVDRSAAVTESDQPFTLTADEINVEERIRRYGAIGHVHFEQGDRSGDADTAIFDERSHDVDLSGHVVVAEGAQKSEADRMHYNTADRAFSGTGNVRLFQPLPTPGPGATKASPAPKKRRGLRLPV